ncbi:carboxypeptidase-like regulatory domain-containing protein [Arthrobacter sp. GCM10027362]|uniref:carboxypeptidase-like regulatory domain-containing protein n=1 Tax=Arthrobacter sp. GCM10027362 TaxID=3273379 RepID=UPI0036334839
MFALLLGTLVISGCGTPAPTKPGETVHPPYVISGTVHDAEQDPVAGARVYFTGGPTPMPDIAAVTDQAGRFSLSVPAPGTYTIECSADGYAPAARSIEVTGSQEVTLELQAP